MNAAGGQPQAPQNQNSFLLDPLFNDYYSEYVMLHKLQALTNNFTCQGCWQVLNFKRFFDDDHECLHKVRAPNNGDQAPHNAHHFGNESIEEYKETRAMLGLAEGSNSPQN